MFFFLIDIISATLLKSGLIASAKIIGAAIGTIAFGGSAIGIGIVFGNLVKSSTNNNSNVKEAVKFAYLGFALCESIALLSLMIIVYIIFVILVESV